MAGLELPMPRFVQKTIGFVVLVGVVGWLSLQALF